MRVLKSFETGFWYGHIVLALRDLCAVRSRQSSASSQAAIAALMSTSLWPRLGAGAVAQSGIDPTQDGRALQDALRREIATRRGYCSWTVDHASCKWVVTLHSPEEHDFYGKTLEEALAWCLVWLMAPEIGVGPFRD